MRHIMLHIATGSSNRAAMTNEDRGPGGGGPPPVQLIQTGTGGWMSVVLATANKSGFADQLAAGAMSADEWRLGIRGPSHCDYCFVTVISIRRLLCRPSAVALSAMGLDSPYPEASIRDASIPDFTSSFIVLVARAVESVRFRASSPTLSVYPEILMFNRGFVFRMSAT